jgi:hypothetical protein
MKVGKDGKIQPGFTIQPNSISTYYIYTARITPIACNVTGYMEGETKVTFTKRPFTFNSQTPSFSANVKFNNISPLNYQRMGTYSDCPSAATRRL